MALSCECHHHEDQAGHGLIGISSIHLLKTFINADQMSESTIYWQVVIHLTFIVSAIAMAITDYIMNKSIAVAHEQEI